MLVFRNKYDFNEKRFKVRYVFEWKKTHRLLINQELKKRQKVAREIVQDTLNGK